MRLITEFGMGTSLQRGDYTEAAKRALSNALWRNSINAAELFGFDKSAMQLDVQVGVQNPQAVDIEALKSVFPYGSAQVTVVKGGLDIPRPEGSGNSTIVANAAISVSFDMQPAT